MAQVPLRPCVCDQAPGAHYCLDCEQYFCDHCKTLHGKVKSSKNHVFQSAEETIPEVKSKCEDHEEIYNFYCTTCSAPVCGDCITGKHHGHKFKKIQDIVTEQRKRTKEILTPKLEMFICKVREITEVIRKFESETGTVIKQIKEDRDSLIALIKSHSDQLISDVMDKKEKELTKLKRIEDKTKDMLKVAESSEKSWEELEKSRPDATLIRKFDDLQDQIENLPVLSGLQLTSITYERKSIDKKEISALIGDYEVRETKETAMEIEKIRKSDEREESIASALAIVMCYDDKAKRWHPAGDSTGISKVQLYKSTSNKYRFVGIRKEDKKVVLNTYISKTLKYSMATNTFHQFRVPGQVYGLNFSDKESAFKFGQVVQTSVKEMK